MKKLCRKLCRWFPKPKNEIHALLVVGNALLLWPYPRLAYQMGDLLALRYGVWDTRLWWIALALMCWLLVSMFWVQARCLLYLEKQILEAAELRTTPNGVSPD